MFYHFEYEAVIESNLVLDVQEAIGNVEDINSLRRSL